MGEILATKETKTVQTFDVRTASEQGLLSVAIHPRFTQNGLIYLHRTPKKGRHDRDCRVQIRCQTTYDRTNSVLFHVEQPFPNHNGGAIRFGADGHLYVGLGDGGWRNDPKANGQILVHHSEGFSD